MVITGIKLASVTLRNARKGVEVIREGFGDTLWIVDTHLGAVA
jgi:hypothetical protein